MSTWTKTTDKLPDVHTPVVGMTTWDDGSFSLFVAWTEPDGKWLSHDNGAHIPDYWFEIPAFIGEVQ